MRLKEWSTPSVIKAYVESNRPGKLIIGAGGASYPGWLCTDIAPSGEEVYLDAEKTFPIPDQMFRYVYSEHVFEHFSYEGGLRMLRESYRILEPGGRIRIVTPDLDRLLAIFDPGASPEVRKFISEKISFHKWPQTVRPETVVLNLQMREWGHKFLYDEATLRESLLLCGFRSIRRYSMGASDDPALMDIESRRHDEICEINEYESMVLEAERP